MKLLFLTITGIAVNKDGIIYFADGANIRMIKDGKIYTIIGSQEQPRQWNPLPCHQDISFRDVTLHWPTALAVSPLDNSIHVVDNNLVLRLTTDKKIVVVAGRPPHCPPKSDQSQSLLSEDQAGPKLAVDVTLTSPQDMSFGPNGDLYVVESDGRHVNRVRLITTDGKITHHVGARSKCSCQKEDCKCHDPKEILATKALLHSPTSVTITPDNILHIADMGNLRIHSVMWTLPVQNQFRWYEVLSPQTQEMYVFNRYGQHLSTKNIITNEYLYNFTYNVNSYYGKLTMVTDAASNRLQIRRDYTTQAKQIISPTGETCKFAMDYMGQLQSYIAADNFTTTFGYTTSLGLLETKQTSDGRVYFYEYDVNGRLAGVIQPTGERTVIETGVSTSGALARVRTDEKDTVAMAANGNMLSVLHGKWQLHFA